MHWGVSFLERLYKLQDAEMLVPNFKNQFERWDNDWLDWAAWEFLFQRNIEYFTLLDDEIYNKLYDKLVRGTFK